MYLASPLGKYAVGYICFGFTFENVCEFCDLASKLVSKKICLQMPAPWSTNLVLNETL